MAQRYVLGGRSIYVLFLVSGSGHAPKVRLRLSCCSSSEQGPNCAPGSSKVRTYILESPKYTIVILGKGEQVYVTKSRLRESEVTVLP